MTAAKTAMTAAKTAMTAAKTMETVKTIKIKENRKKEF
jgi:hypothetical protein